MNVLWKRYSPSSTVLPSLFIMVLHHCSTGPRRICIFPITAVLGPCFHMHLCWAWWSLSLPQQALWTFPALLDPEISILLYIISPSCFPWKNYQYLRALRVAKCQSGQLHLMGGHSPLDTWLHRKWTAYAPMSARLFRVPALSKLTATLLSIGYKHLLSLPCSLLQFHT